MTNQKNIFIAVIILLLIIIAVEYYYFHNKAAVQNQVRMSMSEKDMFKGKGWMMMQIVTPPPLSDQQTQQLTDGTNTIKTQKTFNITAGNFYFVPNKITVNLGDQITFVMTNAGGLHNLIIDELAVKTALTNTAQAATVSFSASKKGSFIYYCSIPGHKAKGMWGTLIVQ